MRRNISIKEDTWRYLIKLKYEMNLRSYDDVIFLAISILDIIKSLSEKYQIDILKLTEDMVSEYEKILSEKVIINEKRRGL